MSIDKSKNDNAKDPPASPKAPVRPELPRLPPRRPRGPAALFRKSRLDHLWDHDAPGLYRLLFHPCPGPRLEDSGELAVGSFYAGVPHPPGYPGLDDLHLALHGHDSVFEHCLAGCAGLGGGGRIGVRVWWR